MSDPRPRDEPDSYFGPPPTGPRPAEVHGPGQPPYPYPSWPGYPPPGAYPPVPPYGVPSPYGAPPPGERRPGTLLAAAVLGYVTSALLVLAGLLLASSVSLLDDVLDSNSFTAEFTLACLANFAAAGLLIGGGVAMTTRNRTGRLVYSGGAALVVALTVYWLSRWATITGREVVVVYGLLFAALAVVGLVLSYVGEAGRWLAGGSGSALNRPGR